MFNDDDDDHATNVINAYLLAHFHTLKRNREGKGPHKVGCLMAVA